VAPPKAGEVRVKIVASGVCHTDAYTLSGKGELFVKNNLISAFTFYSSFIFFLRSRRKVPRYFRT